jgi:hypothetical protein
MNVARGSEDLMLTAAWLDPLKVHQLAGKELGIGLFDLKVRADSELKDGTLFSAEKR